MANTFKRFVQKELGSHDTQIFANMAENPCVIMGLSIANTSAVEITVKVRHNMSDSTVAYIGFNIPIGAGRTLDFIAGNRIVMESGDAISVEPNGGTCDVIISTLYDVNTAV